MQVEYPKDWMTASLTQAVSDNNPALQKFFSKNPLVSGSINGISDALVSFIPFKLLGAADYQANIRYETGNAVEGTLKTNPYDLLKKNGIPQTLTDEEISAANKLDLQMMAKKDLKMVNDVAKEVGVDRNAFGEYIHELKADLGVKANQNFTYKELLEYAKQLKGK